MPSEWGGDCDHAKRAGEYARFLTVSRNFLNDVGVNLDFILNKNATFSKKFGTFDPITGAFRISVNR